MKTTIITITIILFAFLGYSFIRPTLDVAQETPLTETNVANGNYCFIYDLSTPEQVDMRSIAMSIEDGVVTGDKLGRSQNPEYHASDGGTLSGTIDGEGMINALYTYEVEGDTQVREERYLLEGETLTEFGYPFTEDFEAGILRINESVSDNGQGQTFPTSTIYSHVACEKATI